MKTLLLTSIAALFLATGAKAQTHDTDFPIQMDAINQCYIAYNIRTAPPPRDPITNEEMIACMEAQNFLFCNDCQIFRYSGGPCRDDKWDNGPHRATCWRKKTTAPEWKGCTQALAPLSTKPLTPKQVQIYKGLRSIHIPKEEAKRVARDPGVKKGEWGWERLGEVSVMCVKKEGSEELTKYKNNVVVE